MRSPTPAAAAAAAAAAARPGAAPAPLLTRRISARNFIPLYLAALALGGAVLLAGHRGLVELDPVLLAVAALAPLALALLRGWVASRAEEYRLFPESLEVRRGIFGRRIENVQLFRVRDISFRQGFLARLLDVGDITLRSTDESSPVVTLRGVASPLELYEQLRHSTAALAASRTMLLEREPAHAGDEKR